MSPMMLNNVLAFIGPNKEKPSCPSSDVLPILLVLVVVALSASIVVVVLVGNSMEFSKMGCPGIMFR